jgi:hypothetical protein
MLIRIFASLPNQGLERILKHIETGCRVEHHNPARWIPNDQVADVNIHLGYPCRLACPLGRKNIMALGTQRNPEWKWIEDDMDVVIGEWISTKIKSIPVGDPIKTWTKALRVEAKVRESVDAVKDPMVAIITLTRNRVAWWPNMVQNVLNQDWPRTLLQWVIVDDGDESLGVKVAQLKADYPDLNVKYVELESETLSYDVESPETKPEAGAQTFSIGLKRNKGVAAAPDADIYVMMDDDDHYPASSVSRRLIALTKKPCVYCSSIQMYDLRRYISAMNVPPLECSPEQRVSEATLAFTRAFWLAKPFPDLSMAEGYGFIEGRVSSTMEIAPSNIIVSFLHKGNSSSRRVPPDQEPNGCHYGFSDKYFTYLHKLDL